MNKFKTMVGMALMLPIISFAQVSEYQLDNGLKLLVKPDRRAPVVVSQIWYKVGSSYEYNGITGLSHQLEHMMFKGTENLKPKEFSQIIAANGGSENAFTGRDYTAYFQTLAKDRLEVSFKLEAERMSKLVLDEAELAKERAVVAEERRRTTEDKPKALLREAFNAAAFVNSPYHHPVIGWMNDIEHYNVADLRQWYRKWYAPNNATLVVAGDVEPDAVYQLAKRYFGVLKPTVIVPPKPQLEIKQVGKRMITVHAPAQLPYFMMGWKVPVLNTVAEEQSWEPYALDVLAGVLDGGDSARFARELVRGQQIAAGIGVGYNLFARLADHFVVAATPVVGKSVAELQQAVFAQLAQLKTELLTEQELQRIKTQVVANAIYERDSLFYQAMQLGSLETVGLDWRLADQYVANIEAVTAEQVQQVAQKYFIEQGLTVAELIPEPLAINNNSISAGAAHVH